MTTPNIKLSITVVSYNHGQWLAECLESIVSQKVDFPFEVIIGDDASTDDISIAIIEQYAKKFPTIIKPIYRDKNIGPIHNYLDIVAHASGEYIAHIDGDDYMLPGKIKSQVDFLDNNPNYNIASHRMIYLKKAKDNSWKEIKNNDNFPTHGTVYDLLKYGTYFCHSSKMYRKSAIITKKTNKPIVDFYLHIEHAYRNNIFYSNEILGCYRIHDKGISKDNRWASLIQDGYNSAFNRAIELGLDKFLVERSRSRHQQARALACLKNKNFIDFKKYGRLQKEFLKNANIKSRLVHHCTRFPKFAFILMHVVKKYSYLARGL